MDIKDTLYWLTLIAAGNPAPRPKPVRESLDTERTPYPSESGRAPSVLDPRKLGSVYPTDY